MTDPLGDAFRTWQYDEMQDLNHRQPKGRDEHRRHAGRHRRRETHRRDRRTADRAIHPFGARPRRLTPRWPGGHRDHGHDHHRPAARISDQTLSGRGGCQTKPGHD